MRIAFVRTEDPARPVVEGGYLLEASVGDAHFIGPDNNVVALDFSQLEAPALIPHRFALDVPEGWEATVVLDPRGRAWLQIHPKEER